MLKMFTYYGAKHSIARVYPAPQHKTIIEPFAGSAGYSLHYPERDVILFDADPKIAGIWSYLIRATAQEILALPADVDDVTKLDICQEAKWLIGYWLNTPSARPVTHPSPHMRKAKPDSSSFWGPTVRQIIANQVLKIKHWRSYLTSYEAIDDLAQDVDFRKVTWFIDPPYQNSVGRAYDTNLDTADFPRLGRWCRERSGQVIVCEQEGADWLPFKTLGTFQAGPYARAAGRNKAEVIWTNEMV